MPKYNFWILQDFWFSVQFHYTRSLSNSHLHPLWKSDFCVCQFTPCRLESYLCVHYLRRLFSEDHLRVRCHCSLEQDFPHSGFKIKNQRIPPAPPSVLKVRIKKLNEFQVSGSQNYISACLSLTCVPSSPLESEE